MGIVSAANTAVSKTATLGSSPSTHAQHVIMKRWLNKSNYHVLQNLYREENMRNNHYTMVARNAIKEALKTVDSKANIGIG